MGLGSTSLILANYCGRAASATWSTPRSLLSTTTQSRSRAGRPVDVLYVDRGVIVLNKPPGLVVQGTSIETPVAAKGHHRRQETIKPPSRTAFDDVLDGLHRTYGLGRIPYPVHRLDKGTTGVMILARTKPLARELAKQFRTHTVEKSYLALGVHGKAKSSIRAKEGVIDASLSFNDGRVRVHDATSSGNGSEGPQAVGEPGPGEEGKAARTSWEVLASSDVMPLSLVRLNPHTGLKHQLRVHMAHALKVPILGDALYGGATSTSRHFSGIPDDRLFLHSSSISFWRYRRKGFSKRFRLTISAPLPADFVKMCRKMNFSLHEDVIKGGAFVDGQRLLGDKIPGVEGRWFGGSM